MKEQPLAMAWNEPGGSKKNDPWTKKSTSQSPPDLDKILKNIFGKFRGSGSSGGSGSGSGYGGGASFKLFQNKAFPYIIFAAIAILYVLTGFYRVNPPEQAVVTRFGHYQRIETPGLHWLPQGIEAKKIINVERIEATGHGGGMLTKDENIVAVEVDVQYRIADPKAFLFNNVDPVRSLKEATESALRQVVGHLTLNDILTTEKFSDQSEDQLDNLIPDILQKQDVIKEQVQTIIDRYETGLQVTTVAMKQPRVPKEVKDAFDDVIKAREDRETVQNTAKSYANKVVPEAEGQAERVLREARAYEESVLLAATGETARFKLILPEYKKAPLVTKTRLYLETVEEVLSNTSKVLVDLESGSHNILYLPIDKLLQNTPSAQNPSLTELSKLQNSIKLSQAQAKESIMANQAAQQDRGSHYGRNMKRGYRNNSRQGG